MNPIRVLHITAHLGGGVGRVLSQLALFRTGNTAEVEDAFVSLEAPETTRYADTIAGTAPLYIAPSADKLKDLVRNADIVQLEWWHHPLLAGWMNRETTPPMRLVVWAHTSGLHYPAILPAFACLPHAFLLTSRASKLALEPCRQSGQNIREVVNSSGGFDDLPLPQHEVCCKPRFGYLGSLNPAKLHPEILSYLDAVEVPDFAVDLYGDASTNARLRALAREGANRRFILHGFTDQPAAAFCAMDVLVYLLNPAHYGTTENALLEAMACGVVPVVLNNPVEKTIVEHGKTGLVVDSPRSFAHAIAWLCRNPEERLRLSADCAASVRQHYSISKTAERLDSIYGKILDFPKKPFDFRQLFGNSPSDWFLSCLGTYSRYFKEENEVSGRRDRLRTPFLYEQKKSSAMHFSACYPFDSRLAHWAAMLQGDLENGASG